MRGHGWRTFLGEGCHLLVEATEPDLAWRARGGPLAKDELERGGLVEGPVPVAPERRVLVGVVERLPHASRPAQTARERL